MEVYFYMYKRIYEIGTKSIFKFKKRPSVLTISYLIFICHKKKYITYNKHFRFLENGQSFFLGGGGCTYGISAWLVY